MKMRWIALLCAAVMLLAVCVPAWAEEITIPEIDNFTQFDIPDNEAMAYLKSMGVGWNLGNTFDAHVDGASWFRGTELDLETAWVGVKTSEALIAALHDMGFSTIRVPVSWHEHVSGEDFAISEAWLGRVQEVVDYAINQGMHVILNTHHDVYPEFYYPSSEHFEQSEKYLTAIWTQLAARFADYDDHLIFESMNEPRLKDTSSEWYFNATNPECKDSADCINRLNQVFVNTVRASGGNNATRYLMVPGYCAAPENALNEFFVLPEDTADNRIIVSVHAYTPYSFALQDGGTASFTGGATNQGSEINRFITSLYNTYISQGIPVVIGEFGARDKGNLQARVDFAAFYAAAASARNIPCCWWDNGAFSGSGEVFGLIRRDSCEWQYPQIAEAIVRHGGYDKIPAKAE
ncbi:MAG: glycoside hydrolase family 5 protein [Christensenellaceae bacterium]|nr:glycoside hydrolase family 5 protein [Christensenellaceae bacterium]